MNLTMTLTLDGLIRALRWKEHDLAETIERGYARRHALSISPRTAPRETERVTGDDDDRRGR
jgi:hypothetical protein